MVEPKFKHHVIYYTANILIGILGLLPYSWMGPLGRTFGLLVFRLAKKEREKTVRNIRTAFPNQMTWAQAEKFGENVWIRLGWNLFEVARWVPMEREAILAKVVRVNGYENLEKALAKDKGVILFSGHLGNWELLSCVGAKTPIAGVAQNLYDPRFDRLVTWMRSEKLKVAMIKRGLALRGILEALKGNKTVFALVDQDTGKDGVFVPFFGKPAWTQSGMARIAYKTGAALVPAFVVRGTDGQFELHVEREIEVPHTGDAEKDVLETVRRYTEVVESYVKAYPDQWMWMHERWKTRPPGEKV